MPALPSPPSPTLLVRLIWSGSVNKFGSRFYLNYSGSAPSAANLNSLASNVGSAWASNLASVCSAEWSLVEVDVTDITTPSGFKGSSTTAHAGTMTGNALTAEVCALLNFQIGRRYRGGKPRIYLPQGSDAGLLSESQWTTTFMANVATGWTNFIAALVGTTYGGATVGAQVNVGYYHGVNAPITLPSGRVKQSNAVLSTPHYDFITGHSLRQILGSQRKRLTSKT